MRAAVRRCIPASIKIVARIPPSLNPGIYYIYGGITSGTITGTGGVTIVNLGPNPNGSVTFNGHNSMDIVAPTTRPTAGVAFYQPPSNTGVYTGNGKPGSFAGLFYAPTATYRTNGNGDTFAFIVVGSTDVTGNKPLTVDPSMAGVAITAAERPTTVGLSE